MIFIDTLLPAVHVIILLFRVLILIDAVAHMRRRLYHHVRIGN